MGTLFGYHYNDLLEMTSTTSCSAIAPASCPTASPVCYISAQEPLYNLTGLGGQTVCQIGLPPETANSSILNDLAGWCIDRDASKIRVQDDCEHYCASALDESDFNKCIHQFLTPGFIGHCQNISEKVDTGSGEMQHSRMGWASLAVMAL